MFVPVRFDGDHAPDVVHTHNLTGVSTAIWEVCRRLDLPVFHSLHDYYLLCPRNGPPIIFSPDVVVHELLADRDIPWLKVCHAFVLHHRLVDLQAPLQQQL